MSAALVLARSFPFLGRCAVAFIELVVAAAIIVGSVVVGHDLAAFRAWYSAPTTIHHWVPMPQPSTVAEPSAR